MKKILGLDLGTNSIGWAVVNQAVNPEEKSSIVKLGVRTNPLTTDEKKNFETSKGLTVTAERTHGRGMRRNLQRYKLRRKRLIQLLKQNKIITDDTLLSEDGPSTTFQTYRLRAKAAKEEISLEEFGRVLLMINKKRGYKSNRKTDKQEDGEVIDGMTVARRLYDDNLTPGEYVYEILQKNTNNRKIPTFYSSDLNAELNVIWERQSKFYPDILDEETKKKITGRKKNDTLKIFYAAHNISATEEKDNKLRRISTYRWRAESAQDKKVDIEKVVAAIASINGDLASSSGYLGEISDHSKELYFKKMTVGEFLMAELAKDPHYRIKNHVFFRQDYLQEFETIWETQAKFHKELTPELKKEIRDTVIFYQRRLKSQKKLIAFCEFESKEIVVNGKKYTSGSRVCPKSSPLFQEFKIWQSINNIVIENKSIKSTKKKLDDKRPSLFEDGEIQEKYSVLNDEQRELLRQELAMSSKLSQKDILKIIGLDDKVYSINFKEIQGNTTQTALLEAYKKILDWSGHDIDKFDKLNASDKKEMIKSVFCDVLGLNNVDFITFNATDNSQLQADSMFKLWHLLYSYEDDKSKSGKESLIKHISELTGLNQEYAAAIAGVSFTLDYGSLSSKAIFNILPFLKKGNTYDKACELAGYRHSKASLTKSEIENKVLAEQIDILQKNSLRNPVVEKIINQMIHVVNNCVEAYGPFDEIHIEMARELKQNKQDRKDSYDRLNERTKESEDIKKILHDEFKISHPSRADILRYRLYLELAPNGFKTLYSNTEIPQEKLFTHEFNIEHIIPQAKIFDDSISNKTIETAEINREKGDMTAYDYVIKKYGENNINQYKNRIAFLFDKKNSKGTNGKYKRLMMSEADIPSDFLNRDLSDSQYIARKATEILSKITRYVVPTTGSITARLREDWQLINVMQELNWEKYKALGLTETFINDEGHEVRIIKDWTKRNDNRHHAMDALTIAFTRREHIQFLNNLNASGDDDKSSIYYALRGKLLNNGRFIPPMPYDILRAEAKRHLSEILVSIKAKNKVVSRHINKTKGCKNPQITLTPRGQLHMQTVYGEVSRYITKVEKIDSSFNQDKITTVARKDYREALLKRLQEHNGDAKKAFTGKYSLEKEPLFTDKLHTHTVPTKVKTVTLGKVCTSREPINKNLSIDKITDARIKKILLDRIKEFGDANKAFSNIDENPIWLNKEKGISIKRVTLDKNMETISLHEKKDKDGNYILDKNGNHQPVDFVQTRGNHHSAIFLDENGKVQEHLVSFLEAITRANQGLPIVDKQYNSELGWTFLFTLKQNEIFIIPDEESGFNPNEIDLKDKANYALISQHLFRVQAISKGYYIFRNHLETNVEYNYQLRGKAWIRITNIDRLKDLIKVRIDHIGRIVAVGEY
jgi:CRISPR-associated endonuclease Csn1